MLIVSANSSPDSIWNGRTLYDPSTNKFEFSLYEMIVSSAPEREPLWHGADALETHREVLPLRISKIEPCESHGINQDGRISIY